WHSTGVRLDPRRSTNGEYLGRGSEDPTGSQPDRRWKVTALPDDERQLPSGVVCGWQVARLYIRSRGEVGRSRIGSRCRAFTSDQSVCHAGGWDRAAATHLDHAADGGRYSPL